MKNLIYVIKYFAIALTIGIVTTLFWTCSDELFKEKLQQVCEDESQPVIIQFKAMTESICGTKDSLGLPQNTMVEFSFSTPLRSNIDTFIYLDAEGNGQFEIYDGCTGVDLLWIKANNGEDYLSWNRDSFGVLCCQENLIDSIYFPCSNSEPTALNCDALNDTIQIDFNMLGKITTLTNELPEFEQAIISSDTVSIDFSKLEEFLLNNPQVKVDYRPNLTEPVFEVSTGNAMVLQFSLDNSQIIEIVNETIELPTVCINEPTKKGVVLIIINAIVEEVSCNCPYEGNPLSYNLPKGKVNSIPVGESISYNDLTIPWSTLGLDTSCTVVIESVVQESGDAQDHPEYWSNPLITPTANARFKNTNINVSADFNPLTPGTSKATYTVSMHVESSTGATEGPCSFTVECESEGCENSCPSIRVLNTGSKLDDGTNPPSNIAIGTLIDFDSGSTILRNMKRTITTDCFQDLGTNELIVFDVEYDNEYACSSLNLNYTVSGTYPNDLKVDISSSVLNGILPQTILVTYSPPLARTEGQYNYTLTITAGDGNGYTCSQVIQITGNVESITSKISTDYTMSAFSQIADDNRQSLEASHAAYKIDAFDATNKTYGKISSRISSYVETATCDYAGSDADYSFYFDVENPKDPDINYNEKPELYLVNNNMNNFEYITQYPVAYLRGSDDLDSLCSKKGNYELIRHIFSNNFSTYAPQGIAAPTTHNFTYQNSPMMWNNNISKNAFAHPNGVQLEEGGVYVIWNTNENPTIFDTNKVYCHLALLFVYDVKTGQENKTPLTNENGRATATFYVQYPLEIP